MAISLDGKRRTKVCRCDPQTPLFWVLSDALNLTGTKFGCGIALNTPQPIRRIATDGLAAG